MIKDNDLTPSHQNQPEQEQAQSPNWWRQIWENLQIVVVALAIAFLIRAFIAEPRYIPSDSMLPTLEVGDRLVVEKVSYYFQAPQPGDIVVFSPPPQLQMQGYEPSQAFIKRVIGTPGDIVMVLNGTVYVNNLPISENYIYDLPQYTLEPLQVPDGQVFVMGDNRNNSNDSHIWGFLPQENIIGQAVWRFWPLSRVGKV
ncbi:MAG: signal peptidase I [Cyanophyceae cyanobacterium]